jgi:membrane fusion protein (multidrug efflux system)
MSEHPTAEPNPSWLARNRLFFMVVVPLLLGAAGVAYYMTTGRYISTDDAFVQAARVQVSADISARVVEIPVHDNQHVHKGDLLFRLNDASYAIDVRAAEAALAQARLQIKATKESYRQRLAGLKAAQDDLAYQQREYQRQTRLAAAGISSQAQLDKTWQALQEAQQAVAEQQQGADVVRANLGGDPDIAVDDHPSVRAAIAALDRAKLYLSYTRITAPIDGVVTKVEQLQIGDFVTASMPMFSLVSSTDVWVEANFKETELTHMRVGQPVTIAVDTYPGRTLTGKVESLSPGTGSSFALLPPENATGNWVKVVQRLPVRISIDDPTAEFLGAGMSVDATVDTGYRRSLFGGW